MSASGHEHWLERPSTVRGLVWTLYAVCGLLLIAELFIHRHTHFDFEGWFGFYGFYGFLAYIGIVFSAKGLRKLIRRSVNYYDPPDTVQDKEPEA